jgi:hypothetical protein
LFQSEARATETSNGSNGLIEKISTEVINIFGAVASATDQEFNEQMVDGGLNSVCVTCDEDFMIAIIYIADCLTFKRNIDLECFNVAREREKMVDTLMSLLEFD